MTWQERLLLGAADRRLAECMRAALDELIEQDACLLEIDAHERSITHRLAVYLERKLERCPGEWNVDCEYNRATGFDNVVKRLGLGEPAEGEGSRVFPDIIVHRRGERSDLLVVEVKKSSNRRSRGRDLQKLLACKEELGYQHGLFVELSTTPPFDPPVRSVEWY